MSLVLRWRSVHVKQFLWHISLLLPSPSPPSWGCPCLPPGAAKTYIFFKKVVDNKPINHTSNISVSQFMVVRQIFCTLTGAHCQERQYSVLLPKKQLSLFFHENCSRYHYLNLVSCCRNYSKVASFPKHGFLIEVIAKCVMRKVNRLSILMLPPKRRKEKPFSMVASLVLLRQVFSLFLWWKNRPFKVLIFITHLHTRTHTHKHTLMTLEVRAQEEWRELGAGAWLEETEVGFVRDTGLAHTHAHHYTLKPKKLTHWELKFKKIREYRAACQGSYKTISYKVIRATSIKDPRNCHQTGAQASVHVSTENHRLHTGILACRPASMDFRVPL